VDDIVDTGETLLLARDFILREWGPSEVRIAVLQWISSVAKFKPDYYHLEVRDWTWFQYPWTRLEDVQQFIVRLLREDEVLRGREEIPLGLLEERFREWYGVSPGDFSWYWPLALERLEEKGVLERSGDKIIVRIQRP